MKKSNIDQKIAEILEEVEERRKTLSREETLKRIREILEETLEIFNIPEDDGWIDEDAMENLLNEINEEIRKNVVP